VHFHLKQLACIFIGSDVIGLSYWLCSFLTFCIMMNDMELGCESGVGWNWLRIVFNSEL
jgi:hypothetical protein